MAILTDFDYNVCRDKIYRNGDGKEELKSLAALPSETQLRAIFQACEDRGTAAFSAAKADIETILGVNITNSAMKKITRAWMRWRDLIGG